MIKSAVVAAAVLSWHPVSRENCAWVTPASCVAETARAVADGVPAAPTGRVIVRAFPACTQAEYLCDVAYIGLRSDSTVTWKLVTSTEQWKTELAKEGLPLDTPVQSEGE